MSTPAVQNTAIDHSSRDGVGYNEAPKVENNLRSNGPLDGVRYVKEALAASREGLSDAELNVLAHAITQLTAAFSIQQSFSSNVTAFEQLEKALQALGELLQEVEKAKNEMKEGLRTIILSEALSAVLGGVVMAKSLHTAVRQFRYTKFANNVERISPRQNSPELDVRVLDKGGKRPGIGQNRESLASPKLEAKPNDASLSPGQVKDSSQAANKPAAGGQTADADGEVSSAIDQRKLVRKQSRAERGEEALARNSDAERQSKKLLDEFEDAERWSVNPIKSILDDERVLSKLPNSGELSSIDPNTAKTLGRHAGAKASNLANILQIELQAARLVQQFAHTFKYLGETQQSLAQIELNADSSVYSNQAEYWSTLMGVFQRLGQEYQTAFQNEHGTLEQDVAQANMMAQYVYRS